MANLIAVLKRMEMHSTKKSLEGRVVLNSLDDSTVLSVFEGLLKSGEPMNLSCPGLELKELRVLSIIKDKNEGNMYAVRFSFDFFKLDSEPRNTLLIVVTFIIAMLCGILIWDIIAMSFFNIKGILYDFFISSN